MVFDEKADNRYRWGSLFNSFVQISIFSLQEYRSKDYSEILNSHLVIGMLRYIVKEFAQEFDQFDCPIRQRRYECSGLFEGMKW